MTPFARLALLAATSLYALGLALVVRYLGVHTAIVVALLGPALAVIVSLELAPSPTAADEEAASSDVEKVKPTPARVLVTRDRKDIERSARAARDEE